MGLLWERARILKMVDRSCVGEIRGALLMGARVEGSPALEFVGELDEAPFCCCHSRLACLRDAGEPFFQCFGRTRRKGNLQTAKPRHHRCLFVRKKIGQGADEALDGVAKLFRERNGGRFGDTLLLNTRLIAALWTAA